MILFDPDFKTQTSYDWYVAMVPAKQAFVNNDVIIVYKFNNTVQNICENGAAKLFFIEVCASPTFTDRSVR